MCALICSGFVHANICMGEWLGGWPSHSVSNPIFSPVNSSLKPKIITIYIMLPIFSK